MEQSKFNIVNFLIVLLIALINAFALSSIICSLLVSIDTLMKSDYKFVLPVSKSLLLNEQTFSGQFFAFISSHYYLVLLLGGILILGSLIFYILLLKNYATPLQKAIIIFLLLLVIPFFYFISKEYSYIQFVLLIYLNNLDMVNLFQTLFLSFFYPSAAILMLGYVVFAGIDRTLKTVLIIVIVAITIYLNYDHVNSVYLKAQMYDSNKTLTDVKGIISSGPQDIRPFSLIFASGEIENSFISTNLSGLALNAGNKDILEQYLKNHPETLLNDQISYYMMNYFMLSLDIKALREFKLGQYLHDPDFLNSIGLLRTIKNASAIGDMPEMLETAYKSPDNYVSKTAYGFLAMNFVKSGDTAKATEYWKEYEKATSHMNEKQIITPLIEEFKDLKASHTNISGQIMYNNKPLANKKLLLIDQSNAYLVLNENAAKNFPESFVSNIISSTHTDKVGKFTFSVWNYTPSAIMIEGKYRLLSSDNQLKLLESNKMLPEITLGIISLTE